MWIALGLNNLLMNSNKQTDNPKYEGGPSRSWDSNLAEWIPGSEKYCLFCGAGFSKWAIGLPTAYELFDFNIKTYGPRENVKLNQIRNQKQIWDMNHPVMEAEDFIAFLLDQSVKTKKLVTWYIARRLAEPFIERTSYFETNFKTGARGRRIFGINDRKKFQVNGIKKAESFFNNLPWQNLEGILTTNYDLVIEYALGTKRFFYGDRPRLLHGPPRAYTTAAKQRYPVYLTGKIPIAKLHGSISLTEKGYCADGRGCITGKAIIIPPAHNKKISDSLTNEWAYARNILKQSKIIVFFGFRFNSYDRELMDLFTETVPWIQKIILINPNPEIKLLAEKIWPSAEIKWIPPDQLYEDLNNYL